MATIKFKMRGKNPERASNVLLWLKQGNRYNYLVSTQQKVYPDHFNEKTGRVRNVAAAIYKDEVNSNLDTIENKVKSMVSGTNDISKEQVVRLIDETLNPENYIEKEITLFEFIRSFIDRAPTRLNSKTDNPVCYKQVREYERTFYYLRKFCEKKKRTLDFKDIDLDFYHDFVTFLQSPQMRVTKNGKTKMLPGLAKNTIGKKIQTLKIFLNAAVEEGITTTSKHKSSRFKSLKEESENVYLNEDELLLITNLDLSKNKRLERVRDLFLIGCWTGLRFSDWNKVKSENIEDGFLTVKQSKTGNPVVIPIHPTVKNIIEKYEDQLPPMISNQKFNDYIKDVVKLAGIKEKVQKTITIAGRERTYSYEKWEQISTHSGRRSFATNAYKAGIPSLSIMAVTGHRTESSFLKYIKVTPKEHAEKIKAIWQSRPFMRVVNE